MQSFTGALVEAYLATVRRCPHRHPMSLSSNPTKEVVISIGCFAGKGRSLPCLSLHATPTADSKTLPPIQTTPDG